MKNIRPEVISKGEALVKISHFSGEATAYSNIASLICNKIEDLKGESYDILSELLSEVAHKRDEVSEMEIKAKVELDELLRKEKSALSQAVQSEDNTHN